MSVLYTKEVKMKKSLLALAVAASVASFAANAAVEGSFALGAGAGWTHAFNTDVTAPAEVGDKNGYALKLNGEYNFTDWFGLGLGYDYLNGAKIEELGSSSKYHNNIVELYGRFALPLDNQGSDVFFKVGPTWNRTSNENTHDDNIGAVLGVGAQWAINQSFNLRAGYDYFFKTSDYDKYGFKAESDTGLLYVGFNFVFGGNTPAPVAQAPAQKQTVRVTENHSLAAGLLFPFDGSTISQEGKKAVADVVASSKNLQNTEFAVYGYTDRIGSDAYNQKLSQKRADAVAQELQANGVTTLTASEGRGKSSPVTGNKCDSVKGRAAVIDCLSPDRRVEIVVTGDTVKEEQE